MPKAEWNTQRCVTSAWALLLESTTTPTGTLPPSLFEQEAHDLPAVRRPGQRHAVHDRGVVLIGDAQQLGPALARLHPRMKPAGLAGQRPRLLLGIEDQEWRTARLDLAQGRGGPPVGLAKDVAETVEADVDVDVVHT